MSEFSEKQPLRIAQLQSYLEAIIAGENGKLLYQKYEHLTNTVTAEDILIVVDNVMTQNHEMSVLKRAMSKWLHIFYKALNNRPLPAYDSNSIFYWLLQNNQIIDTHLKEIRAFAKQLNRVSDEQFRQTFLDKITALKDITLHYTIKENIVFPFFEGQHQWHRCTQLMWSIHDDIRKRTQQIAGELEKPTPDPDFLNHELGLLYFDIYAIIFREEKILFPELHRIMDKQTQHEALVQSVDIGFPFATPPSQLTTPKQETAAVGAEKLMLSTGEMSLAQMELLFKHLPIDITFVDENDQVRFFSDPPHRIFPRSKAIIGRKVQNCHPPESVDIVNQIVAAFKKGTRNKASFWIHIGPKFVLIEYFAVRDAHNNYKGVVEVSQEITEISQLKGNQRLLDWE